MPDISLIYVINHNAVIKNRQMSGLHLIQKVDIGPIYTQICKCIEDDWLFTKLGLIWHKTTSIRQIVFLQMIWFWDAR